MEKERTGFQLIFHFIALSHICIAAGINPTQCNVFIVTDDVKYSFCVQEDKKRRNTNYFKVNCWLADAKILRSGDLMDLLSVQFTGMTPFIVPQNILLLPCFSSDRMHLYFVHLCYSTTLLSKSFVLMWTQICSL